MVLEPLHESLTDVLFGKRKVVRRKALRTITEAQFRNQQPNVVLVHSYGAVITSEFWVFSIGDVTVPFTIYYELILMM